MYPRARLPGIYVDTVNPPPVEGLPRMDVAVFAGFAASGPCHRAVLVDSVAAFEAVFGGDLPLAFDKLRGETLHANLPLSVRAFFSNGGVRCWVIRLAMTKALAKAWEDEDHVVIDSANHLTTSHFAMSGLLARMPDAEGNSSEVRPALLAARSGGSWADDLALSARVLREPIATNGLDRPYPKDRTGIVFDDENGLAAGDLIEFAARNDSYVRYAKIVRVAGGKAWACWIAAFAPESELKLTGGGDARIEGDPRHFDAQFVDGEPASLTLTNPNPGDVLKPCVRIELTLAGNTRWFIPEKVDQTAGTSTGKLWQRGHGHFAGRDDLFDAFFSPGDPSTIIVPDTASRKHLHTGRWIKFTRQGTASWLMIDSIDGALVKARAWQQVSSRMPAGKYAARRVTLEITARQDGASSFTSGLGLSREHSNAIHALIDDDSFYAPEDKRAAASRAAFALSALEAEQLAGATPTDETVAIFGTKDFKDAHRIALRTGWLPLGLGADFANSATAIAPPLPALARDGLAAIDEKLFLDPRLADLTMDSIAGQAEQLRNLQDEQLFGIHAAIDIPSDLYSPASIIAVPDAVQPDWALATDAVTAPAAKSPAPSPARLHNHLGGCPTENADKLWSKPDWSRFLDSDTAWLPTPAFIDPPSISDDGSFMLTVDTVQGGTYILDLASRHDFADAVEVWRGEKGQSYAANLHNEGVYYFRLHVEQNGNTSSYATHIVTVRTSDYRVSQTPDRVEKRLKRIQIALLRLAAGTSDYFAVLSLPRDYRAAQAGAYARTLPLAASGFGGRDALGAAEQRALSFGALYHPWLVTSRAGKPLSAAPDGAIAGVFAARARARGAWTAPANELINDIIGLDPATTDADLLGLDQSRVNTIRRLPAGFAVLDADTLSNETEWRQINVRRLMMLIRRAALRRGMTYIFEPNGDVVRRAVERSFSVMLDDLQRRGAFSEKTSAQSFRLAMPEAANDRDNGRMTVEIAVRPAQAMRFLTLRMAQQGTRLTIAEVA
jgi:hypothetical protein